MSMTPALVSRVMAALGFAVFAYTGITTILNNFLADSSGAYSSLSSVPHALLNMAGFDQSLSILGSALSARVSLLALKHMKLS